MCTFFLLQTSCPRSHDDGVVALSDAERRSTPADSSRQKAAVHIRMAALPRQGAGGRSEGEYHIRDSIRNQSFPERSLCDDSAFRVVLDRDVLSIRFFRGKFLLLRADHTNKPLIELNSLYPIYFSCVDLVFSSLA